MPIERYNLYSNPDSGYYFRPSRKEKPTSLLTDEFAMQLFEVTQHFEPSLQVASLVAYTENGRIKIGKEIADEIGRQKTKVEDSRTEPKARDKAEQAIEILKQRLSRLESLPETPISWRYLLDPVFNPNEIFSPSQKQVLIKALKTTLRDPNALYTQKWLDPSVTVDDLRAIEVGEDQLEESGITRTKIFLSKAF